MKHNIYTIYDTKAEAFSLPFYYMHDGQALRTCQDWINNPETPYAKHPEDYTLFKAGQYDENTGTITQDKIESIATFITLTQEKNQ
ncbi:nonstructural protein [Microviridae sp.]|nr:nonstructural protein [Microviridae sp.]